MPARSTPSVRFLRHILLPVVAGLLAAVLFVACEALPTDPAMEADRSIVGAERMDGMASATALPAGMQVTSGTTSFMCVLSTRTDGASAGAMSPAYRYRYVGLAFDEHFVQAAQGEVMTLTYRLRDERGQITRQATCRVPAATGVDARLVAWLFPQGLTDNMRAILDDDKSLSNATLHTPVEGEPCYDDPDFVWIWDPISGTWGCDGVEVIPDEPEDEEEVEPIDDPGGGCYPFPCPDMPGDDDDPPPGGGPGTPPSDDCPDDNDDTPAPPEGGDEPCDFDCWEPPDDDDDPFNPPGFMSVQSWQTTSSGMAVAVYQPASAECQEDGDDPPPCDETDFGDPELQQIIEALAEQGYFQQLLDDSDPYNDTQMERKEQGGWVVQESDGSLSLIRYHHVEGADIEYTPTGIRGVKASHMPENAVAMIHTHPFGKGEALTAVELVEQHGEEEFLEDHDVEVIADNFVGPNLRSVAEPSENDFIQAGRYPDLKHIILGKDHIITYEAELDSDEDGNDVSMNEEFEGHGICGVAQADE